MVVPVSRPVHPTGTDHQQETNMSSQTLAGTSIQRQNRLTVAAVAAVISGLAVTLFVAAAITLNPTPARIGSPVLGPMDDYYFRHPPAPKVLGPMDDYYFRHAPAPEVLGPMDDFGTRNGPVPGG
jgi:hypothetical protein